jgi:hypothetical protein
VAQACIERPTKPVSVEVKQQRAASKVLHVDRPADFYRHLQPLYAAI